MKNFTIEEEGHTVRFITMNRRRIQLFQVYSTIEGKEHRFHMQINEQTGDFAITEKFHCPPIFLKHEQRFNEAIKAHGIAEVIPT
jgi:hypothetical protein